MENNHVSLVEDTHHKSPSIQQTTRTSHTTSELVHSQAVNLSMPPGGPTHPFGSLIHPTPTSTPPPLPSIQQLQQANILQQPITFVFERFCSGVPTPLSMHTPLPSPKPIVRSDDDAIVDATDNRQQRSLTIKITQNNDTVKKNRRKRKHNSYGTPIDSPISLNRDEDSKSESEYGDNLLTEYANKSEAFSDYGTEDSSMITPVDALKRLLMQFTAMSPMRLESILPVLLDNDIDDPDILLLIENEQFLRDLRGKNGSEISRGNCLLLWHGIQEHRNNCSTVHTPKSFSSCASSSYSPPPSRASADQIVTPLTQPKSKKPKLDLIERENNALPSLQDQRHQNLDITHYSNKQRVKAPKLSMSTIEEVHTRVDCVLSVVTAENERRKQIAHSRNNSAKPTVKFEDFVAELKQAHKIPVAFGTLRDMRFAYMLKKLDRRMYMDTLANNRSNVTEFYRRCQEVCEENFKDEELEAALPWLNLKAKMYYK
ncbi:16772_t:CDS:2 [Gigaspora margarita]|uniref:16772_t:CDS:1 n=2 Tax=Gigaspora margarita TaxID=4874 RepID=A0ABN7V880_GIGMA|nr:hypothetical protein F8M41_017559 [Gigaspora margarita]CAG8741108.1 16772_t:CDS:2 [Gigaspora margarita]